MHVKYLIYALCVYTYSTLALAHHGWLDFLLNQLKSLEPHEVLFLDHDTTREYSKERDLIIRTVSREIPVMKLRVPDIKNSTAIQEENKSRFTSVTKHTTLVIILAKLENDTIHRLIDFLTTMTYNMRPNTLLLSLNHIAEKDTGSSQMIESILNYAWSKRFLDFTILTKNTFGGVDPEPVATIYSLNPFYGETNMESLDSTSSLIFPYKLRNLNEYPITFPFFNFPPLSVMTIHKNRSLEICGLFYPPINFVLTEMNFTKTVGTMADHSSTKAMIESFNQMIFDGKVDMLIPSNPLGILKNGLTVETGTDCEKLIAVVPVMFERSFNVPSALFLHACIVTLIILTIILIKHFIAVAYIQWTPLHICALILGVPVSVETKKLCSKIIYLSIAFMSILYSNELFSTILSINVSQTEVPFETYENIDASQLSIISSDFYYHTIFPDPKSVTDPHLKNIMHKIIRITSHPNDLKRCFNEMGNGVKQICIMSSRLAKIFMDDHIIQKRDSFLKMKIAEPVFACEILNVVFEPSSLYAERFLDIQRRMQEGGDLYKLRFSKQSFVEVGDIENNLFDDDISTPAELLFILAVGYVMSIIIVLMEFLWQKYKNRRTN